jgi:deoxyribodipyrimidine photo-lyase
VSAAPAPVIVWFRQDLRLRDNPALHAAHRLGAPVVPVYVWSPGEEGDWPPGAASRWWLHRSLASLDTSLRERGSRLLLRTGNTAEVLGALARETGAGTVLWNRRYEPAAIAAAGLAKAALRAAGLEARSFNAALLVEPWDLLNQSGGPYQVYTPFRRRLLRDVHPDAPLPAPRRLQCPTAWPTSVPLEALGLQPRHPWAEGLERAWQPGEPAARSTLRTFVHERLAAYDTARDVPGVAGTSRLSPHLHFGEIGPRQVWHAIGPAGRASQFLAEVVWREFAYHLLYHFPHTPTEPLRGEFRAFPWRDAPDLLHAWQRGRTGIALVDAGMRELWATGWMHNRVRMIAGSFLVKNLLQPWQQGARWFWDTLVDADLASNTLGWQWVAGCGADAAPFFRTFNPVTQGKRFDAQGAYVRQWIPSLRELPDRLVHEPGQSAGHPPAIVDLGATREAALEAYQAMRRR